MQYLIVSVPKSSSLCVLGSETTCQLRTHYLTLMNCQSSVLLFGIVSSKKPTYSVMYLQSITISGKIYTIKEESAVLRDPSVDNNKNFIYKALSNKVLNKYLKIKIYIYK